MADVGVREISSETNEAKALAGKEKIENVNYFEEIPWQTTNNHVHPLLYEVLRDRAKSDAMRLARKGRTVVPKRLTPFTCKACLDRDLHVGFESKRTMPQDVFVTRAQHKEQLRNPRHMLRPVEIANQLPNLRDNMEPLFGVHIWPDGDHYIGWWLHRKRHGKGTLSKATGETYTGDWKEGFMDGKGHFKWHNGDEYIGDYVGGFREGQGHLMQKSKTYIGQWKHGNRHGYGTQTYRDGSEYEGYWLEDKPGGGKGCRSYANGDEYFGTWQNGKRHGQGELLKSSGASYEGDWVNGFKHGFGEQKFRSTNRYKGQWNRGKPHGKGTLIYVVGTILIENGEKYRYAAGDRHEGMYKSGKREGPGSFFHADGRVFNATWLSDNTCEGVTYRSDFGGKRRPLIPITDRKRAHRWSLQAVCEFLRKLTPRGDEYAEGIKKHAIQGQAFLSLTNEDLVDKLGVKSGLIRARIMNAIHQLSVEVDEALWENRLIQVIVELGPDDREFAEAKSKLMSNMGISPAIEHVQVLRIFKIHNSVLDERFRKFGQRINHLSSLEKSARLGFYNTTEREHLDIACMKGMYHLGHPDNPSKTERDRWFGDPRKGVYIARQCVKTLFYLSSDSQKTTSYTFDEESDSGLDDDAVIQEDRRELSIFEFAMVECYPGKSYRFEDYWQIAHPKKGFHSHTSKDGSEWYLTATDAGQVRPLYKFQVLVWPSRRK